MIFFTSRIGILSTPEIVQFLFQLRKQHRQDAVEHQIERRGVEQRPEQPLFNVGLTCIDDLVNTNDPRQGFSNSLLYALVATTLGVVLCAMAAFVMCRKRTRLNVFLYYFVLCGLFFPVNYVTLVRVLSTLHLNDTRQGIIMVFTSAMIPFCVFTIRNFVVSVPVELDEAAVIDGAGPISLFFKIIMPLLKPTMVTCFILQFMGVWSDFLTPLYLSSKSKMFPMTMAVYQFFGKNKSYWNYIFADIVLTCIPVVIVYMIGQKYIVGGMTSGAVKE